MAGWRWHTGAVALYAATAYGVIAHGAGVANSVWSIGSDPYLFMWCLAWWPYAIAHHLNPLFSNLVWQPWGIHLAWTTCVPLLALLTAPVTLMLGPGASFNLAMLAAPVVSAFAAWLLCLRLTGRPMAALIGGFLYGFSAFEMAECLEELNLAYNFAPPLLALLAIERLGGRISGISAVAGATLTLTAQFYISVETFATTVVFAGSAWLLAIVQLPDWRSRLVRFLPEALAALGGATSLATPQLLPMLTARDVDVPRTWPYCSRHIWVGFLPLHQRLHSAATPLLQWGEDCLASSPRPMPRLVWCW